MSAHLHSVISAFTFSVPKTEEEISTVLVLIGYNGRPCFICQFQTFYYPFFLFSKFYPILILVVSLLKSKNEKILPIWGVKHPNAKNVICCLVKSTNGKWSFDQIGIYRFICAFTVCMYAKSPFYMMLSLCEEGPYCLGKRKRSWSFRWSVCMHKNGSLVSAVKCACMWGGWGWGGLRGAELGILAVCLSCYTGDTF